MCIKEERGTLDCWETQDWTVQPLHKLRSWEHVLLNVGDGPVLDPGNGSGREQFSFLSVQVLFVSNMVDERLGACHGIYHGVWDMILSFDV